VSRFRRFMHLEKDRDAPANPLQPRRPPVVPETPPDRDTPVHATPSAQQVARFGTDGLPGEGRSAPEAPTRSGAALERFSASSEAALRTDASAAPAITGSRCYRCEREFGRFDVSCRTCGAPLDTPEQQAFTRQLAQDRAALLAQEQAEVKRRQEEQRRVLEEADRLLRQARNNSGLFSDPLRPPSPFPAQRWLRGLVPTRAQQNLVRLITLLLGAGWLVGGLTRGGGFGRWVSLGLGGFLVWAFFPRWWHRTPPANGPPSSPGL